MLTGTALVAEISPARKRAGPVSRAENAVFSLICWGWRVIFAQPTEQE